jgi:hypothetical protein
MNELLIEKLYKQSLFNTESDGFPDIEMDIKKFAELIVNECVKLYNHDDMQAPVGNSAWGEAYQEGWIAGAQRYKETIKEHFGIEQ